MSTAEVVEYLVITDRAAADGDDLYPTTDPSSGTSTVSIPLRFQPLGGVAATRITTTGSADANGGVENDASLWIGALMFPSGNVLFADWSMQVQTTVTVQPGQYAVIVFQDQAGRLSVDLRRGAGVPLP